MLSTAAALAHLVTAPDHYTWWPAAGVFFAVLGVLQLAYSGYLFRGGRDPRIVSVGIWGTVGVILLYVASRTVGLPTTPPVAIHGGRWVAGRAMLPDGAKHVGPLDLFTLVCEVLLVVTLLSMLPIRSRVRTAEPFDVARPRAVGDQLRPSRVMAIAVESDLEENTDQSSDDSSTVRHVLLFAGVIAVLLLVRSFALEPVRVRSDSMAPALSSGAMLLIDKVTFRTRDPHRGEIVVAIDPRTGESIVKRVVAVGGDSVGIEDGILVLNGKTVFEDYIDNDNMDGFFTGPDPVPLGHVYLLGDNRETSEDSRTFGPVDVDDIEGKVLVKVWPLG